MNKEGVVSKKPKKAKRGRPVEYPIPEPIPDTPANIVKAFLKTPPRKREEWEIRSGTGQETGPVTTGAVVTIGYNPITYHRGD